ncbi:beta-lactoglobulin-like [Lycaon pictus]
MRSLLLALALVCGIQAIVVPRTMEDLDLQKVAGTWHSMAMAASDISLLDAETAPLRVYIQELRPTPQDNLEIVLRKWEDSRCAEQKVLAEKTEVPAEFKINCECWAAGPCWTPTHQLTGRAVGLMLWPEGSSVPALTAIAAIRAVAWGPRESLLGCSDPCTPASTSCTLGQETKLAACGRGLGKPVHPLPSALPSWAISPKTGFDWRRRLHRTVADRPQGLHTICRNGAGMWALAAQLPGGNVEENQIFLLDTDYDNYLFFCMENTDAPQQSLMCQCLGMRPCARREHGCSVLPVTCARTLEVDNEVMEKFNRALKTLPVHMQLLNPTQAEEQCLI